VTFARAVMRRLWPMLSSLALATTAQGQQSGLTPVTSAIGGATAYIYSQTGLDDLHVYVFAPPDVGLEARPAIVLFSGGLWSEERPDQFVAQARYFRGRGMVAVLAEYRVRDHHATPLESMADAKAAIRWVRRHASELAVDPTRIAAGGADAGSHAALSAAMFAWADEPPEDTSVSAYPDALVLFRPVVDTSNVEAFGTRKEDASPARHLDRALPPTVIFQGRQDPAVDASQVERFCANAAALGGRCEVHLYDGAGPDFFERSVQNGRWYLATLLEADRFLTSLGYLPAPVSAAPR
jgi:acetyl esterase/lipase